MTEPTPPTTAAGPTIAVAAADALGEALRRTPARPMQEPLDEESIWFGWAAVLLADVQREGWALSRQQNDPNDEATSFARGYTLGKHHGLSIEAHQQDGSAQGFSPSQPGDTYWRDTPMAQALREKAGFPLPPSAPPALSPADRTELIEVVAAMVRGELTCEKGHRAGKSEHVHFDDVHRWGQRLARVATTRLEQDR